MVSPAGEFIFIVELLSVTPAKAGAYNTLLKQ